MTVCVVAHMAVYVKVAVLPGVQQPISATPQKRISQSKHLMCLPSYYEYRVPLNCGCIKNNVDKELEQKASSGVVLIVVASMCGCVQGRSVHTLREFLVSNGLKAF